MKKVLLVGELNEIVRSLNECLMGDFQVQLCIGQLESVQGMVSILRPDLIVISQISLEEMDGTIFEWLKEHRSYLPVLVISTIESWKQIKPYCQSEQFHRMFRPIAKTDLLEKCYELLKIKKGTNTAPKLRTRKKILVVDDSPLLLRSIKGILEKKYTLFLATSGEQALSMILSKQPDLVLLDYEMPGMDGKKTFEAMLEDEFAKDIPVIFLTSIAERSQIYAVLKSYPADYILKPPEKETLLRRIEEVLWKSKKEES